MNLATRAIAIHGSRAIKILLRLPLARTTKYQGSLKFSGSEPRSGTGFLWT